MPPTSPAVSLAVWQLHAERAKEASSAERAAALGRAEDKSEAAQKDYMRCQEALKKARQVGTRTC